MPLNLTLIVWILHKRRVNRLIHSVLYFRRKLHSQALKNIMSVSHCVCKRISGDIYTANALFPVLVRNGNKRQKNIFHLMMLMFILDISHVGISIWTLFCAEIPCEPYSLFRNDTGLHISVYQAHFSCFSSSYLYFLCVPLLHFA